MLLGFGFLHFKMFIIFGLYPLGVSKVSPYYVYTEPCSYTCLNTPWRPILPYPELHNLM